MSPVVIDNSAHPCSFIQDPELVCSSASICGSLLTKSRMELTRQAGNEPALVGLMRVYKDYYPDVIVGAATSGRASVFTVSALML